MSAWMKGHQEVYAIHGSYAENGEDPRLRRIAQGAIPLIRLPISQLTKMQAIMGGQRR